MQLCGWWMATTPEPDRGFALVASLRAMQLSRGGVAAAAGVQRFTHHQKLHQQ